MDRQVLLLTQRVNAPPQRVFRAWSNSDELAAWAWGTVGRQVEAAVDFREGGSYRISTLRPDGARWSFAGEYLAIIDGQRIRQSVRWDAPMGYDDAQEEVEVLFAQTPAGTRLEFRHEGDMSAQAMQGHREGWLNVLATLARWVEENPA